LGGKVKTIKFAVLGFGGAGRAHVQRLQAIKGVEVKVVYDPKIAELSKVTNSYRGISFTNSLDDIFGEQLDAVTVCTPDHTHFEYAKIAVQKRLHTLVEKPMFVTNEQCEEMDRILKANDVIFGVHHQMRYIPTFRAAYELVRKGVLGEIVAIEADYIHDMRQRATAFDNWRIDNENPQNIVLGGLSHTLDLIRWIANEEVEDLFSFASHKGWKEYPDVDTVVTTLRFPSGLIGKTSITITSAGPQRNTLTIYGTKCQIHNNLLVNDDGLKSVIAKPEESINWKQSLVCKIITNIKSLHNYPFSIYEHNKACNSLLINFVDAIQSKARLPTGFSEGRRVIELCLGAITSYKTNKPFRLSTIDDKSA
jgi:predicted dehydrogenase